MVISSQFGTFWGSWRPFSSIFWARNSGTLLPVILWGTSRSFRLYRRKRHSLIKSSNLSLAFSSQQSPSKALHCQPMKHISSNLDFTCFLHLPSFRSYLFFKFGKRKSNGEPRLRRHHSISFPHLRRPYWPCNKEWRGLIWSLFSEKFRGVVQFIFFQGVK